MDKILIEYNSNNSGGSWWLKDKDWLALEKAGWKIIRADENFVYEKNEHKLGKNGLPMTTRKSTSSFSSASMAQKDDKGIPRWLGAMAKYAFKRFETIKDALVEFEKVTGADVMEEGCNCCGAPHSFSWKGGYCSGEDCGEYLYGDKAKMSKRELLATQTSTKGGR